MAESEATISGRWAARLRIADLQAASRLRLHDGILVAADAEWLWLQGPELNADLLRMLRQVGPTDLYSAGRDGKLVAWGDVLPSGYLPALAWMPVQSFFVPTAPPSVLSASVDQTTALRLIASGRPRDANALLASLEDLALWVENAAEIRLRKLSYAASRSHALVLGDPLPPIPGVRHYEISGICIPNGYELQPAVDAASLRVLLGFNEGDLSLFDSGGWQRIPSDSIVSLTRGSFRMTLTRGKVR